MKGYVQIYKVVDDERHLIDEGSNMLLDGFSELLTDIMTITPELSSIPSTSAILDCSNFTIQAISYAKSPSAYAFNAHGSHPITVSGRSQSPPEIWVVNQNSTSSYIPCGSIPTVPSPGHRLLEMLPSSVSSLMIEYGQNLNLLRLWSHSSAVSSIGEQGAYTLGCYGLSNTGTSRTKCYLFTNTSAFIASSRLNTNDTNGYNSVASSMDWRGFQTIDNSNSLLGLVASSNPGTLSSIPQIRYQFRINARSLATAALYGGITTVGLWCIDLDRTLQNASPPFIFNVANPTIEYKLVAKRVFTRNLAYIEDRGSSAGFENFSNLSGEWLFYF